MEANDYIEERVQDQIYWYDKKSKSAQRTFKVLRLAEVVFAAIIPLIAGFEIFGGSSPFVVSILGACIAVCAALIGLGNYQENWVEYRTTCESLRHEKYLFLTKTEPYDVDQAYGLFVKRVEGLVSKENSVWSQHIRTQSTKGSTRDTKA
ncbi:DUF4231 domain-containing protein [Xanthomonas arboricola]|uniref:DUF4231 domain-containing protein n=1 Tax=Xanthomonas arboricola TaxID=56448 RepID=UPI0009BA02C0|nr:DUF4231 domain-containing protein [Xanthomonas arboricola]